MANKLKGPMKNYLTRLIIKLYDYVILPGGDVKEIDGYLEKKKILPWKKISEKYPKTRISRLFTTVKPEVITEMVKKAKELNPGYKEVNLNNYLAINCPAGIKKEKLLEDIKKFKNVENAYIEAMPAMPQAVTTAANPRSRDQHHLDPSPTGIDARHAWNVAGGDGTGSIKFIDIEQGWILSHEDFPAQASASEIKLLSGENTIPKKHGTGVLGIILAQDNNRGGIGIVPAVKGDVISSIRSDINNNPDYNPADAIFTAVHLLFPGDILLIEESSDINDISLPCEAEPHIFDTISTGTSLGIVIIEPAGNGNFDLDNFRDESGNFIFKRPAPNTPSRNFKDSGAIMVGAATSAVPHLKHPDSNFGSRIDCFAWGEDINTTGGRKNSYTTSFGGTSGASAIIAGVAISVQSMKEANSGRRLNPRQMRKALSDKNNGTASATPATDRIGAMPDLQIFDNLIQSGRL